MNKGISKLVNKGRSKKNCLFEKNQSFQNLKWFKKVRTLCAGNENMASVWIRELHEFFYLLAKYSKILVGFAYFAKYQLKVG